ncbi:DUF29 domain-containing protein [Azospirillum sp. RWY-5-1]|uniref:DUF29 domain-containing protein n=1 Tax=Azospirillum oleiclasticum TaxID=2735135 RepID=A0ABX2TIZ6_9PROT|nr:DUF29 domain-containing protein [Azospirillum oleiclasticum]NYZ16238.1 DUF29 domain-containing protein [Azospirillum oleiclasticum]NYZ23725.1 DUF29 domain-containing protein [Azospirillum oleiclasticum]
MPDGPLYETDWYAWTQEQAAALRRMADARANTELDLENLAEEVESLGRSEASALRSDLVRVIEHLLKLEHSPAADPRRKWQASVIEHRSRIETTLDDSGTLRRKFPDLLPAAWKEARKVASSGLELFDGLPADTLPDHCPYDLAQLRDDRFWPVNRHGLE